MIRGPDSYLPLCLRYNCGAFLFIYLFIFLSTRPTSSLRDCQHWNRRWFVLDGSKLYYLKDDASRQKMLICDVMLCTVKVCRRSAYQSVCRSVVCLSVVCWVLFILACIVLSMLKCIFPTPSSLVCFACRLKFLSVGRSVGLSVCVPVGLLGPPIGLFGVSIDRSVWCV